ncbi:hypothetical protein ACFYXL_18325 [Streptomyces tsukubensis]|uniref:hypothetical protein n=1 Tax=Streptomyces tsukubensis TaxID=83656 RepID=UPI003690F8FF
MAKYRVWLEESVTYLVEIDAIDREEAKELAQEQLCNAEELAPYFEDSTGFCATDVVKLCTRELVAA